LLGAVVGVNVEGLPIGGSSYSEDEEESE